MNAIVITVILAISQASVPVPRQAANNTTGSGHNVQKNRSQKDNPSTSLPIVDSTEAQTSKDAGEAPGNRNAQNTIIIREPVPVSVRTTWWERFYVIFTGLLVLIGGTGVCAAIKTLRIISHQTVVLTKQTLAARRAADAAAKNIELLISKERARVRIEMLEFDFWRTAELVHYRWHPYSESFLIGTAKGRWDQCGGEKENYAT